MTKLSKQPQSSSESISSSENARKLSDSVQDAVSGLQGKIAEIKDSFDKNGYLSKEEKDLYKWLLSSLSDIDIVMEKFSREKTPAINEARAQVVDLEKEFYTTVGKDVAHISINTIKQNKNGFYESGGCEFFGIDIDDIEGTFDGDSIKRIVTAQRYYNKMHPSAPIKVDGIIGSEVTGKLIPFLIDTKDIFTYSDIEEAMGPDASIPEQLVTTEPTKQGYPEFDLETWAMVMEEMLEEDKKASPEDTIVAVEGPDFDGDGSISEDEMNRFMGIENTSEEETTTQEERKEINADYVAQRLGENKDGISKNIMDQLVSAYKKLYEGGSLSDILRFSFDGDADSARTDIHDFSNRLKYQIASDISEDILDKDEGLSDEKKNILRQIINMSETPNQHLGDLESLAGLYENGGVGPTLVDFFEKYGDRREKNNGWFDADHLFGKMMLTPKGVADILEDDKNKINNKGTILAAAKNLMKNHPGVSKMSLEQYVNFYKNPETLGHYKDFLSNKYVDIFDTYGVGEPGTKMKLVSNTEFGPEYSSMTTDKTVIMETPSGEMKFAKYGGEFATFDIFVQENIEPSVKPIPVPWSEGEFFMHGTNPETWEYVVSRGVLDDGKYIVKWVYKNGELQLRNSDKFPTENIVQAYADSSGDTVS